MPEEKGVPLSSDFKKFFQAVLSSITDLTEALDEVLNILAVVKELPRDKLVIRLQKNIEMIDRLGDKTPRYLNGLSILLSRFADTVQGNEDIEKEITLLGYAIAEFNSAISAAIDRKKGKIQALLRSEKITEHPLIEIIRKLISDASAAKKSLVRFDEFISEVNLDDVIFTQTEEEEKARMKKMITPELLTYFTRKEALDLLSVFFNSPSASYFSDIYWPFAFHNRREIIEYVVKEIKGRDVIEIGSNGNQSSEALFLNLGAKSYKDADVKQNIDALSALARQKSESAIIISFALFAEQILYPVGIPEGVNPAIFARYRAELCKHIYRVTPRGAITLHGLEADCMDDLLNAGFVLEKCLYNNSGTNRPPSGQDILLCAFRKV
jgi:hypothetical protein